MAGSEMQDPRPTHRQLQMILMCAAGKTQDEIAAELYLSPHTVKTYLDQLRELLGARNVTHAVVLCMAAGYLTVDVDGARAPAVEHRELVAA